MLAFEGSPSLVFLSYHQLCLVLLFGLNLELLVRILKLLLLLDMRLLPVLLLPQSLHHLICIFVLIWLHISKDHHHGDEQFFYLPYAF